MNSIYDVCDIMKVCPGCPKVKLDSVALLVAELLIVHIAYARPKK